MGYYTLIGFIQCFYVLLDFFYECHRTLINLYVCNLTLKNSSTLKEVNVARSGARQYKSWAQGSACARERV